MTEGKPGNVKAVLTERIRRTPSVESFRFSVGDRISFLPGQFCQVIFDRENPGNRGLNKYLSFSSSPERDYVEVTKKISESEFSRRLMSLRPGDEVLLKAPMGKTVFRDGTDRIGFLIGGIGITPVISIVEHIVGRGLETDVALLYMNRTLEETAFRLELEEWSEQKENIRYYCFLTREEPMDGRCAAGRIDRDAVLERIDDCGERTFFVYGPPKMVEAMGDLCRQVGCDPERLKTESFAGY